MKKRASRKPVPPQRPRRGKRDNAASEIVGGLEALRGAFLQAGRPDMAEAVHVAVGCLATAAKVSHTPLEFNRALRWMLEELERSDISDRLTSLG